MALINWDDSFSVKVVEIDDQHKKLVQFINDLNDAMKQGKGKEIIGKVLDELINYTAVHFKTEEKYFDQFNYPETITHKLEHSNLVKKVVEFRTEFQNGRQSMTIDVLNFLVSWLKNHILVEDMKYSIFFNQNGLK